MHWCTYGKNCKFSHKCELCGCIHPTTNCPTWTSKSGKCQYQYSHPPSIHKACKGSVVFSLIRTQTHSCQTSFSFHQTHQSTQFHITHVAHIVTTYLHLVAYSHPHFTQLYHYHTPLAHASALDLYNCGSPM